MFERFFFLSQHIFFLLNFLPHSEFDNGLYKVAITKQRGSSYVEHVISLQLQKYKGILIEVVGVVL